MKLVVIVLLAALSWFLLIGLILAVLAVQRRQQAYERAQQKCQDTARRIVPDVDPVAWCEP